MTDNEKKIFGEMMAELQAAIVANPEQADTTGPIEFCASVEHIALKNVVMAFHSWVLVRSLTQSMRLAEAQ